MKKLLALVLALVMTLGLATVGSNAAFADADKVEHLEAVEVLNSLGVINGKENNNFDPTANVKRSEMAKMVTIAMLGDVDVSAFEGAPTDLTDIDGHWAEAYIKFCVSQGIVGGRGNGKFDPDANVTATEAAKMMLTAIGYNADVQGYGGDQWKIAVVRDAQLSDFYDELSNLSADKALTRDETAQMVYNAIQAATITKTANVNRETGAITDVYNANGAPLLNKTFGALVWIGTYTGNYDTGDTGTTKGAIEVDGKLDTADSTVGNVAADLKADLGIENIGEQIKVIFKDAKGGVTSQPDKDDTIYGVYNTGKTTVVKSTRSLVGDNKSTSQKIKVDGTLYDLADTVTVVTNYKNATVNYTLGAGDLTGNSTANSTITGALKANDSGDIKLVFSSGKVRTIYVTQAITSRVTGLTSSKVQLLGNSYDKDDCIGFDSVAVGDYVRYANLYPAGVVKHVLLGAPEFVEGKITAFNASGSAVQIDGTWYSFTGGTAGWGAFTPVAANDGYAIIALTRTEVGDTYRLMLDGGNIYGAYKKIEGLDNYAVATAAPTTVAGVAQNRFLLADGSKSLYSVSTDGVASTSGVLYKYSLSGSEIKLGNVSSGAAAARAGSMVSTGAAGSYTASTMAITVYGKTTNASYLATLGGGDDSDTAHGYVLASDAIIFLENGGSWKTYSAKDVGNFTITAHTDVCFETNSAGKIVALSAHVGTLPAANSSKTSYGFVTGKVNTKSGDEDVSTLTIWNGASEDTVTVKGNSTAVKGSFVSYPATISGSYINDSDVPVMGAGLTWVTAKVKEYNTTDSLLIATTETINPVGNVVAGTDTSYQLTSNTKIIGVNTSDNKGYEINTVPTYTHAYQSDNDNVMLALDGTKVVAVFVDENNTLGVSTVLAGAMNAGDLAALMGSYGNININNNGNTIALNAADITAIGSGKTVAISGAGAVSLTADATLNGTLKISGVTGAGASLACGASTLTVDGGRLETAGDVTITAGDWIDVDNEGVVNIAGKLTASAADTAKVIDFASTASEASYIGGDVTGDVVISSGTLNIVGELEGDIAVTGTGTAISVGSIEGTDHTVANAANTSVTVNGGTIADSAADAIKGKLYIGGAVTLADADNLDTTAKVYWNGAYLLTISASTLDSTAYLVGSAGAKVQLSGITVSAVGGGTGDAWYINSTTLGTTTTIPAATGPFTWYADVSTSNVAALSAVTTSGWVTSA